MTLERAVQRLTSELATDASIEDRGRIAPGLLADLVLFDPKRVSRGKEVMEDDLPGGGGRFMRDPTGIMKVIVNGEVVVDHGTCTAARPGRIV